MSWPWLIWLGLFGLVAGTSGLSLTNWRFWVIVSMFWTAPSVFMLGK